MDGSEQIPNQPYSILDPVWFWLNKLTLSCGDKQWIVWKWCIWRCDRYPCIHTTVSGFGWTPHKKGSLGLPIHSLVVSFEALDQDRGRRRRNRIPVKRHNHNYSFLLRAVLSKTTLQRNQEFDCLSYQILTCTLILLIYQAWMSICCFIRSFQNVQKCQHSQEETRNNNQ